MKQMLLMTLMALSVGLAAHASDKATVEVEPVPTELCSESKQHVVLPQQESSSQEVLACSPMPCSRCYSKIKACKDACGGDPDCALDCDLECQSCCY
ncbi:hypothetical protein F0U61_23850 [Archangium violaceum]|uniref:hypothetical protein n=1 Tax=Archangium violaceum TaxID=83451 RepID=UPI002B2EF316|nr:hypothetical protein F0U61_23850 [Archangium violaceum]